MTDPSVRLTFLGTGGSFGVPMLGCGCAVCRSSDPRDRRLRTSALVELGESRVLIDASPDLREQALAHGVERVDAVLFTHDHADHIGGIDDLRAYNIRQRGPIHCFGDGPTLDGIRARFDYIFSAVPPQGSRPRLSLCALDGPFEIGGRRVLPLRVLHGRREITGYRFGDLAYITDASALPPETWEAVRGVRALVLNALRREPHPLHFSLEESVETARRIGAERTCLVHTGHELGYRETSPLLPEGIELAYDGLVLEV